MKQRISEPGVFLRVTSEAPTHATRDTPPEAKENPAIAAEAEGPVRRRLAHQPRRTIHHDVLIRPAPGVIGPNEFYRVPVVKDESDEALGRYEDTPELWNEEDSGSRKVTSAARPFGPKRSGAHRKARMIRSLPPCTRTSSKSWKFVGKTGRDSRRWRRSISSTKARSGLNFETAP